MENSWLNPPDSLILHLPWFLNVGSITADGNRLPISGGTVNLPVKARIIHISWHRKNESVAMSYDLAVRDFKAEFARRWKKFIGEE